MVHYNYRGKPPNSRSMPTVDRTKTKSARRYLIVVAFIFLLVGLAIKPFLEEDQSGKIHLAKWRYSKLNKELRDIDDAEQYALKAKRDGVFPCFSCVNSSNIYLLKGQIYKYGVTSKGERGRYARTLEGKNLVYQIQFRGTISQCLKEEKRKIYYYALLPANLARDIPLIRPPGNHRDN